MCLSGAFSLKNAFNVVLSLVFLSTATILSPESPERTGPVLVGVGRAAKRRRRASAAQSKSDEQVCVGLSAMPQGKERMQRF